MAGEGNISRSSAGIYNMYIPNDKGRQTTALPGEQTFKPNRRTTEIIIFEIILWTARFGNLLVFLSFILNQLTWEM